MKRRMREQDYQIFNCKGAHAFYQESTSPIQ